MVPLCPLNISGKMSTLFILGTKSLNGSYTSIIRRLVLIFGSTGKRLKVRRRMTRLDEIKYYRFLEVCCI